MDNDIGRAIGVVIASAFGLALVSVIFSSRSQTANVISSGGNALSNIIGAAVAPVTGQAPAPIATAASGSSSALSGAGSFVGGLVSGIGAGAQGGNFGF